MNKINEVGLLYIQDLMSNHFGYELDLNVKQPLIQNRIKSLCLKNQLDYREVVSNLNNCSVERELKKNIIESILTYETYFFREAGHLKALVHDIKTTKKPAQKLDIISMGCSSGQEIYSISMAIKEFCPEFFDRLSLYGTDVSEKILLKALEGVYSQREIDRSKNKNIVLKNVISLGNGKFKVSDTIKKKLIKLKYQILKDYKDTKTYDYIFCKNVMIYFTPDVRSRVIDKIVNQSMKSGSKLFVGMCESANHPQLKKVKHSNHTYYQKI